MNRITNLFFLIIFFLGISIISIAQLPQNKESSISNKDLKGKIDMLVDQIEPKVIEWRRHIHQNPELSNREFKTAEKVERHLRSLGIEVQTGIAHTGVVGILKGGKAGPTVALRADMDALPVVERVDLPFASKVKSTYNNMEVGVMHACGHDTHVAMLMGAAEVLSFFNYSKLSNPFIMAKKEDKILTLHPAGKKGTNISLAKYNQIKDAILEVIEKEGEISYEDLSDRLVEEMQDTFDGKVIWYVVSVKLDLEARGIIERIPKTSPHRLRMKK